MRRRATGTTGFVCWLAVTVPAMAAPNILLVTVDTLRPDALGWIGGDNPTPAFDALAREGFAFDRAVSPAPLTLPAHSSLFTALVPPRHGVRDNGQILGTAPRLLSEALAAAGYRTGAVVSGYPLSREFGLARGFATYDDRLTEGSGQWLERPADRTTAVAVEWLRDATEPWFLWVHYYDPHLPYSPPADLRRPGPRGDYDGEVAAVDRAVGDLRVAARAGGSVLTVLTADHGESLGEHGEASHGYFVYDSTIRVPLVFHLPGTVAAGRSETAARLVDVAPTVLELAGLEPLGTGLDGVSLTPLLRGESQTPPPAYFETYQPWHSYGWAPLRGLLAGEWKWIAAPRPELYRPSEDPLEERNLYDEHVAEGRSLHRELRAVLSAEPIESGVADDPQVLARLRSLGYLGAGVEPTEPPADLPDPKDRLAVRQLLTEGQRRLDGDDPRGALERFDAALAEEPGNRFALSRSALALLQLGEAEAAVPRLERALAADPGQAETRAVLAEALARLARFDDAAREWMEVARRQPTVARHWSNLGAVLGRAGRPRDAVPALARAAELEPEDPERLIRLAFAEFAAGEPEATAEHLLAAAEIAGDRFPHSAALGLVLARLGREEAARPWLGRSGSGEPEFAEARVALARIELARGDVEAARQALREALAVAPALERRLAADPALAALLAE